jgi:hypothetical protein
MALNFIQMEYITVASMKVFLKKVYSSTKSTGYNENRVNGNSNIKTRVI